MNPAEQLAHGTMLQQQLHKLQQEKAPHAEGGEQEHEHEPKAGPSFVSTPPVIHEGYGFRPTSGPATPGKELQPSAHEQGVRSPLPPNDYGLGWPGMSSYPLLLKLRTLPHILPLADHHN